MAWPWGRPFVIGEGLFGSLSAGFYLVVIFCGSIAVNFYGFTGFGNMGSSRRRRPSNIRATPPIPMSVDLGRLLFLSLLATVITSFPGLVMGVDCPPYEPSFYCMETKVTVGSGGQYPRYIQKSPGSVGGHTEGAGFGCVTGGVGVCGWSGHDWSCSITAEGVAAGAVTYTANLQSETCEFPRTATSPTFSILVDATPPQTDISSPPDGEIVRVEDNITGTATDNYQLGAIMGGNYTYSFLGTKPASDDGGTLYYNTDELRTAFWSVPVSAAAPVSTNTLQEITLYLWDAVGNTAEVKRSMYVDREAPSITIDDPSVGGWTDPSQPVIKGHASDDIGIDKAWLIIKDESADRYWSGTAWVAGGALIYISGVSNKKIAGWEYAGLSKNDLRSGKFTMRAYVKDKVGRVGSVDATSVYKKRTYLGKKYFTAFKVDVKTVTNDGRGTVADSFTSLPFENSIYIESEISPARVAPYLNGNVRWAVEGVNSQSGRPAEPVGGNPSRFKVAIPPIPAWPSGRPGPMGYRVFARVEQESGTLESINKNISQDEVDQCRQEYVDMNKLFKPMRTSFVNEASYLNPGDFPFTNSSSKINYGQYQWAIFTIGQNLQNIRNEYGRAMPTSSGYRNPVHNATVSKDRNSPHVYGEAVDIDISTSAEWLALCGLAVAGGACVEPHLLAPGWVHMGWPTVSPECKSTWPHGDVPCTDNW